MEKCKVRELEASTATSFIYLVPKSVPVFFFFGGGVVYNEQAFELGKQDASSSDHEIIAAM